MEEREDYRDTLYTVDKSGRRKWVYPHYLPGSYFRVRTAVAYLLLAFYLSMPWITVGGHQGILLDIPHRRFTFLGLELWATDTLFLFLFLGIAAMSLFFFTAAFGRVWCGWACPETIFLEFLFRPVERWIEGSDAQRRRLDAAPWSFSKIKRKLLKHGFCAAASWVIASTTLAYFIGREPLLAMMRGSPLDHPVPFAFTLLLMGVMAFQFGWFREQFCTILCPYARFQSVLMDQFSLLVGYDKGRGEPRGNLREKESGSGDCVDCGLCVRVCPTGIDIRNGTQLECVACTACIDACDSVMDKIGSARGLIRYDTEAGLKRERAPWIRPRIVAYALLLILLWVILFYKLATRELVDIDLVRMNQSVPFSVDGSGMVMNQFSLRVANKGKDGERFTLRIVGDQQRIELVSPLTQITLAAGEMQSVPLFVRAPMAVFLKGKSEIKIEIGTSGGATAVKALSLIGPG